MTETHGETESYANRIKLRFKVLVLNLVGKHTFHLVAMVFASLAYSLAKLTVYAADENQLFIYVAGAITIAQSLVVASLWIVGMLVFRTPLAKFQAPLAVIAILLLNLLGTIVFEEILRSWSIEPISQSLFQRSIGLLFTTLIYLGFGRVLLVLNTNWKQVDLAKGLFAELSKQQVELIREIRDSRTFSIREVSLEIQSTLGSLDDVTAANPDNQELAREIDTLRNILKTTESQLNKMRNRFPDSLRFSRAQSNAKYSITSVISASAKLNEAMPFVISGIAFFGFCSWLSYFMDTVHAVFWGATLSAISFGIFYRYEKNIATKFFAESVAIRIFAFETLVLGYLFVWLLILGYFAGDNSTSYGAALAYAAIPFIFFNGGAIFNGVISASQIQRDQFTDQAATLKMDLAELEKIRSDEDKVWKSLFVRDFALTPTMANVVLRDAILTNRDSLPTSVIANVSTTWKLVLDKLSGTESVVEVRTT